MPGRTWSEGIQQAVQASARDKLAAGSQLRAFLFDYYVWGPGVAAAYREATQK